jgi:glycolate oxidase iron-sulfur subunit
MSPESTAIHASPPSPAARIIALADACVLCGLCLPYCPTYALDRVESESPRGRIMLMKGLAEGRIGPEPDALSHLDHCLSCRNCERVCPAQVRYGELLTESRTALRDTVKPSLKQRVIEFVTVRPGLLAASLWIGSGLRRLLPGPWRRLPAAPRAARFASNYPARGPRRGRVGLFLGCLGPHHDAQAAHAAIRLLTALGWEVDIPEAQTCCGAVSRHAGAAESARGLEQRNRSAFALGESVAILTLASGCHESLASAFAAAGSPPVLEVTTFIARDERLAQLRWRAAAPGHRIALHLPCTQRNVTRGATEIAPLLQRIPGLELVALPASGCCGAAGSHMLTEAARADALREPILDAIASSATARLCSANVGCRLHLAVGLEQRGLATRVQHPLELLAEHLDDGRHD